MKIFNIIILAVFIFGIYNFCITNYKKDSLKIKNFCVEIGTDSKNEKKEIFKIITEYFNEILNIDDSYNPDTSKYVNDSNDNELIKDVKNKKVYSKVNNIYIPMIKYKSNNIDAICVIDAYYEDINNAKDNYYIIYGVTIKNKKITNIVFKNIASIRDFNISINDNELVFEKR